MKKAIIFPYTADAITLFENRDDSISHITHLALELAGPIKRAGALFSVPAFSFRCEIGIL